MPKERAREDLITITIRSIAIENVYIALVKNNLFSNDNDLLL
jgi:hypothetical protein